MEGFRSRCRIAEFPTEVVNVGFLGRGNEGIRGGLAKLHPRVLSRRATFLDPCRVNSPILDEGGFDFRGDPGGVPVVNRGHFVGNRGIGAGGNLYPMGDGNGYMKRLINYKAITSNGNASDFGDLTDDVAYAAGVSNGSRFIQMAGED